MNVREVVWWQTVEIVEETTSSLRLDVREVVVVVGCLERTKNTTSGSCLDTREVVVAVCV